MQLLLSFVLILTLINCQKEEAEIINEPPPPETITTSSPLSRLISRTSQNPTESDNVLDNSSCFSVQLPVTVTVNGNTVVVNSESDYQTVQDIKDTVSGNDIVYFTYPISIRFENFTTQTLSNYTELHNVIQNCDSDDGLNEIDCISINYPIVINIFNTNNQVASSITIQSNSQLYSFINGLSSNVIAAIAYPISVTNSSGVNVVIGSNSQLESFIESSIDDCDDDGGSGNPTFISVLTTGTWYVSYFNEDGIVETSDYNGYNFTFFGSSNIEVSKNSVITLGTWSTFIDGGYNKIEFTFVNSNLEDLEEDWIILEYTPTVIRLKHVSGGNGGTDYLNFTKI